MVQSVPPVKPILVATPTIAFGDLIRHSLEEAGNYRVRVVFTAAEARSVLESTCSQVAILDNDLSDSRLRELAQDLHRSCPDVKLVLIPPENDPKHPTIDGIPSAAYLSKPFYLPDLIELMDQLTSSNQPDPPTHSNQLHWINQPILDQLLSTTTASAGAVARREGGFVLGGTLPDGAEASLAALLTRFWQREERSDLVRFARLDSAQGSFECLIYLTALNTGGDTVAGLVYPIQTPLSKVRTQAGPLVHALHELSEQKALEPGRTEAEDKTSLGQAGAAPVEKKVANQTVLNANELILPDSDSPDPEGAFPTFNLAELLGAIPSPDPNGKTAQPGNGYNGWLPETNFQLPETYAEDTSTQLGEPLPHKPAPWEPYPQDEEPLQPPSSGEEDSPSLRWEREEPDAAENSTPQSPSAPASRDLSFPTEDLESTTSAQPLPVLPANEACSSEKEDILADAPPSSTEVLFTSSPVFDALTVAAYNALDDEEAEAAGEKGSVLTSLTSLDQLEPATAGLSLLNYTCVLIPRLPQHYLTGELSEKLSQWVQQLCLAFGWRLEGIALRPDYLQWTVQVAPSISPGNIVKIVRQRTSESIFDYFETLRKQNPSGDFWATGYLIVSGSQPPSAGLLRDYIQQTRRRQGIAKNPGEAAPRLNS